MAVARIGQERVGAGAAILADTLREHGLVDQRHLAGLDEPAGTRVGVLPHPKPYHVQVRAVKGCRARQDAVVVVGEALRLHQGVLAAGGASGEIGPIRVLPVERVGDLFAPHRHQVDRPVAKILDSLGMAEQARRGRGRIAERNRQRIAHVAV